MGVYLDRYLSGECQPVWDELVGLGAAVREEPLYGDALAVARETMRRARANIETLIPRLHELGYEFGYSWAVRRGALPAEEAQEWERYEPPFSPPQADVAQVVEEIERRAGALPLPLSLRAFYEVVGSVNFVGAHATWDFERLDALVVEPASMVLLRHPSEDWSEDIQEYDRHGIPIAPDEYFKYLYSGGGAYEVSLRGSADAPLLHDWHRTSFVGYLRECFRWGGFPGWARLERRPEEDLAFLTQGLLPL